MPPFFEPLTPDYAGRGPTKPNANGKQQGQGPFAYAGSERDARGNARGWSAGAGFFSGPVGENGGRLDSLAAQGHFGGWRGEDGNTNVGFNADAAGARFTIPAGGQILGPAGRIDGEAFTANAGGYANAETTSLGFGANILAGSVTQGDQEENLRLGLSAGVGVGGRAHYGDADGDGVRELGFGFDAGPVSLDIKSEALGHAANWVGDTASSAWNAVTSW